MQYRNAVDRGLDMNKRDTPGRGHGAVDDGLGAPLKMRSIPNVSTDRLKRSLEFYHGMVHTPEGLHEFSDPRKTLVETGMKTRTITHELRLRGHQPGECKHCWGE